MVIQHDELERISDESYKGRTIQHSAYCSKCGYNLRTLPRVYNCPECGNPYRYNVRLREGKGIFDPHQTDWPMHSAIIALFLAAVAGILGWLAWLLWDA